MKLTKTQKLIVEAEGRNILVSAGAGTGKTRVLVERFLQLVAQGKALVTEILALTFTDKAASEMKSRIAGRFKALGMDRERRELEAAYISTFHSFASRILKEHPLDAWIDPAFCILEAAESELLQEEALDEALERLCREHPETLELLKQYGENAVRTGVQSVFRAARTEGKTLPEFFTVYPRAASWNETRSIDKILLELEEQTLQTEWKRFQSCGTWDWITLESFREWYGQFSRKKGRWKELTGLCKAFEAARLDLMVLPWRGKFEQAALAFEERYECLKKEKGVLDFEDLQRKLLELLSKDRPLPAGRQGAGRPEEGRASPSAGRKLRERYRKQFKYIMVDEFQDTNALQVEIVEKLASANNVFWVGDDKQSIYGFRGTSPVFFREREKRYASGEEGISVPLIENFRSTEPLLGFINRFFEHVWEEDGVEYQALVPGTNAKVPGTPATTPVEVLVAECGEGESKDRARMREAAAVAGRIQELHESGTPYGEMVILFRAMNKSAIYEQALRRAGAPYFVISGRGFYHQPEVRDLLNFLKCLENPHADIPLAAVLRSPVFQVTDDTLFWLACYAKKLGDPEARKYAWNPLYEGVRQFEEIPEIPEPEKEKLRFFQSALQEFAVRKDRLRLAELLEAVLDRTSYGITVLAGPHGIRKYANLKKLVEVAREYESRELLSLGDFIRILRGLENQEIRESEAQVEAEKSGRVVRLMTIHKAKGLEFPVVFLADLAHDKHERGSTAVLAKPGTGYGLKLLNESTREFEEPLFWQKIDEQKTRGEKEESKRLFYVAMTRAKERLILSGVSKPLKEPKSSFNEMHSWMEWILASRDRMEGMCRFVTLENQTPGRPVFVPAKKKAFQTLLQESGAPPLESLIPGKQEREKIAALAGAILAGIQSRVKKPAKVIDLPVSAYAAYAKDPGEYLGIYEWNAVRPEKEEEQGEDDGTSLTAADFGTLVHRVLERLDFEKAKPSLGRLIPEVFRGAQAQDCRQAGKILSEYIQTSFFREIKTAKRIFRELPFILDERHGKIHGILDLLYEDSAGKWHIVDYKTAEGSPDKVERSGYLEQMMIYALAFRRIFGVAPSRAVICFLKNQWNFPLEISEKKLQAFETRLRATQEKLLEIMNSMINIDSA